MKTQLLLSRRHNLRRPFAYLIAVGIAALLLGPATAQERFKTPEDAASALATAAEGDSRREMLKILGVDAVDILDSGDAVADAQLRKQFAAAYKAKHSINVEANKKASLIIGTDDFTFPIPLIQRRSGWEFDVDAGRIEILYRRIGRNEMDAVQTSLAFVDAQNEYADKDRGEGRGVYAQRIVSSAGKKNGLFWRDDKDPSPIGEFAAQASSDGYSFSNGRLPYHGYYYHMLTQQGENAPGGALDYIVKGKMIGGFALVAYPADYGNSGVMTFVVNHAGVVYEKDLGSRTARIAETMRAFNPDQTWKKVQLDK